MTIKKEAPRTAATVQSAELKVQFQDTTGTSERQVVHSGKIIPFNGPAYSSTPDGIKQLCKMLKRTEWGQLFIRAATKGVTENG